MSTPATSSPLTQELRASVTEMTQALKGFAPKSELVELQAKITKAQTQIDAVDLKLATKIIAGPSGVSLTEHLQKNDQVARLIKDRRGRAVVSFSGAELAALTRKSIISGTATGVSEGDPLDPVGTATKQVLDNFQELLGFIQTSLVYYINLEEELQLLAGDDTGENLHGLIPQASIYVPTYLSATGGWTFIDIIGTAVQQINAAKEIDPTFVVLNTNDWWTIRLTKDGFGRYILGDPQAMVRPSVFGLDVVATTSIPQGSFLVGSGNPAACQIRDRMELVVEISTEHSDFFVRNLVMLRAEKRLALITQRPNSFVSGTFTRSPA